MIRLQTIGAVGAALLVALPLGALCAALPASGSPPAGSKGAEKRARRALSETFPKTKNLLVWLKETDPEAHARLLTLSRGLIESRESEALEFARANHPELLEVISQLRGRHPAAYTAAVADLSSSALRLARTRDRDPEAYDSALQAWVLRSRARLLAARRLVEPPGQEANEGDELKMLTEAENHELRGIERQIWNHERKIERLRARLAEDPHSAAERRLGQIERKMRKN